MVWRICGTTDGAEGTAIYEVEITVSGVVTAHCAGTAEVNWQEYETACYNEQKSGRGTMH